MDRTDTRQRLDRITDPGLFEELATAALRELDHRCRLLAHVGTNPEGRTVASSLDGITYFSDEGVRRMVAVHHTIQRDLRLKWMNDDGDVPKTIDVFRRKKNQIPELRATLILTTNREPREELVHEVEAAGYQAGIDIEIYPGSVIAHFLDTEPKGQWLRQKYLGLSQTTLSEELLRKLSVQSIDEEPPNAEAWVSRAVDEQLTIHSLYPVSFIVGESGMGKTVACLKCLQNYVERGGSGLLVTAKVLEESHSVADAIEATLRRLHPLLAVGEGRGALSLVSQSSPLLVVVEDVNQSVSPTRLLEKLANWGKTAGVGQEPIRWRVLCPVWPRRIAAVSDQSRETVDKSTIWVGPFSEEEGIVAVQRFRSSPLPLLSAKAIANSLGYDPLLIALHGSGDANPEPTAVIKDFLQQRLEGLAAVEGAYTAGEYWRALRSLSLALLEHKELGPSFSDVVGWLGEQSIMAHMLREIVKAREVVRVGRPLETERIIFRHDRVRDYLLADAVAHALRQGELSRSVSSDPYFAGVIGIALAGGETTKAGIDEVARVNPLALFSAMRHFRRPRTEAHQHIIDAASAWIDSRDSKASGNESLRQAVLGVLAECEGTHVRTLVERVDSTGANWLGLRARFRNGDVSAGIRLCAQCEPGLGWVGHVELIDHVRGKFGSGLLTALENVLRKEDLTIAGRVGAVRLAGYTSSPYLSEALRQSWDLDSARHEILADYLWACSQCCGEEPAAILDPVFDAWAALPDEDNSGHGNLRLRLGADHVRWAFRDRVPTKAIDYFLDRATEPELRWPILVMLNGIDHPDAVEFVVTELARDDEEGKGTTFGMTAVEEWTARPRFGGNLMEPTSRRRLRELWSCEDSGRQLRRHALRLWCATVKPQDLDVLKTVDTGGEIGDVALFERLRRGDETAIPELVPRLDGMQARYWWQAGRYLWSDELTDSLDRALGRLADKSPDPECDLKSDLWIVPELLMELSPRIGERLIKKHWVGLCHSAGYVQAALYFASSDLRDMVRDVVEQCEDPESLFRHFGFRIGIQMEGRRGITSLGQMEAVLPYLNHLSDHDILLLWEACNENGWFDWRRRHLDSRARRGGGRFVDAVSALRRLDNELTRTELLWPGLDQWGEALLKTGVSRDGIMELLGDWLGRHREEMALHISCYLVTRFGKRRHLTVLENHESAQSEIGRTIIDSASFDLRRRSLE
ncbi:MAG: ATP-binding protein [Gemmatimonadetes bacterium]|nr:ATP-binding protein [Gemmatimonadota bacterium]MCY3942879.1 ATP-binding protein [Gemmatimonadota bacterium]